MSGVFGVSFFSLIRLVLRFFSSLLCSVHSFYFFFTIFTRSPFFLSLSLFPLCCLRARAGFYTHNSRPNDEMPSNDDNDVANLKCKGDRGGGQMKNMEKQEEQLCCTVVFFSHFTMNSRFFFRLNFFLFSSLDFNSRDHTKQNKKEQKCTT